MYLFERDHFEPSTGATGQPRDEDERQSHVPFRQRKIHLEVGTTMSGEDELRPVQRHHLAGLQAREHLHHLDEAEQHSLVLFRQRLIGNNYQVRM